MRIFGNTKRERRIETVLKPTLGTKAVLGCGAHIVKVEDRAIDFIAAVDKSRGNGAWKKPEFGLKCPRECVHIDSCPVINHLVDVCDGKIVGTTVRCVESYTVDPDGRIGLVLNAKDEHDVPAVDVVIRNTDDNALLFYRANERDDAANSAGNADEPRRDTHDL